MDQYERPKSRWYKLHSKPGKEKKKERGDLEVRTAFTVKAGSLSDLSKKEKNKSSLSNIAHNVGGSLLSIGTLEKRKGLAKFAKSLGSKVHMSGKKKKEKAPEIDSDSYSGSFSSVGTPGLKEKRTFGNPNADPGVISEDEDEFVLDKISYKSSGSSLNVPTRNTNLILGNHNDDKPPPLPPTKPPRNLDTGKDEWEAKLYGKHMGMEIGSTDSLKRRSWENSRVPFMVQEENSLEREPTIEEKSMEHISLNDDTTAPASPNLVEKSIPKEQINTFLQKEREQQVSDEDLRPKPMPRVNTASEPMQHLARDGSDRFKPKPISPISLKAEKHEKMDHKEHKDNIFTKKLKYFRKESPHKDEQVRANNLYNKTNASSIHSNGERIIIGGENQYNSINGISAPTVEVAKEILQKYEGKSREVSWFWLISC
jgi:Rab11 family-interacting protein 1/2/5